MKRLKQIGLLISLACVFASCHNKAVDYNNSLVKIQQGVLPQVQEFAKKCSTVDSSNIHNILPEATKMVQLLDQKIAEVNILSIVDGGQNLKNAIIDQLEFERNLCYKLGRLGDPSVTPEEKASIEQEFVNNTPDADKITRRVDEAQKDFAEKNHFPLKNK